MDNNYDWELVVADNDDMLTPKPVRSDCTCPEHCKEIARKMRKTDNGDYDSSLRFLINDPWGKEFSRTVEHGKRLKWKLNEDRNKTCITKVR